jgi:curved DNA-binding protein CbpA
MVTVMAAADHGRPDPDLYQLLGVPRGASREEITQAWRRRARAEHPDARPADADAAGRFRAVAEAYRVLGDPARRTAYDRALALDEQPAIRVPMRRSAGPGGAGGMTPLVRAAEPPLRAGPVRVESARPQSPAAGWDEEEYTLAVLAELALRYLAQDQGRPW